MVIGINDQFVAEVVDSVYSSVTEQLTGIQLKPPPTRKRRIENPVSVVVLSKGVFKSKAVVQFPAEFVEAVVDKMSSGAELSKEDREAYFKEYMNIFYGRFISKINNEIGRASRFIIPVLLRGPYRETAESDYSNRLVIPFMSDYGKIEFVLCYEVLPEHSSN